MTMLESRELARFREDHRMPFVVCGDPARAVYRRYGLQRGGVLQVFRWRSPRPYVVAGGRGMRAAWSARGDDLLQLGGDFLVDPAGRLRLAYYSEAPDDRPPTAQLLAAITGER